MLKSKFLAGVLASLIAIVVIVGLVVFAVIVLGLGPENKILTYGCAFGAIALWGASYKWLKPKGPQQAKENDQYKDGQLPPRHQ